MLRSMFSGVSGLRSHQTMMDVIGNNIANVNTTGYKAAAVVFQDLLSQVVQGWSADASGAINPNSGVGDLSMPLGQTTAPVTTTTVHVGGNLPADAALNTKIVSSITVYDKQGSPIDLSFTYEKTATDQWTVTSTMPDKASGAAVTVGGPTTITWRPGNTPPDFDTTSLSITPTPATGEWGAAPTITVDLGTVTDAEGLRQ